MSINIVGKQFELTDSIKNYIYSAFESLSKYNLNVTSSRCVISADERQGKKGFVIDISINLSGKNTIVVREKDKDLYLGIDNITAKLSKILRREHDKQTTHKNKDELKDIILDKSHDIKVDDIDEIVPIELESYKPMEIDEALRILKDSTDQFLVFKDMDARTRVLYKRKDSKFGLF